MPDSVSMICLPDGLEIVVHRTDGSLQARSFRFRPSLSSPIPSFHDASEVLRAKRFNTIEELVSALRAEFAT